MQTNFEMALAQVRSAATDYPHYAQRLREAGAGRYRVMVASHEITYYDQVGQLLYTEQGQLVGQVPSPATFDQVGIQQAIKTNQEKHTDFQTFLRDILEAGVTHYDVDLLSRQIFYRGQNGQVYVEQIPVVV